MNLKLFSQDQNGVVFNTINKCSFPVWVGFIGFSKINPGFSKNLPNKGGWVLNSGESVSISTPKDLYGSRFWGRTNCAIKNGVFSCETGNCANNVQCAFDGIPRSMAFAPLDH
jgi:hypothetical protein